MSRVQFLDEQAHPLPVARSKTIRRFEKRKQIDRPEEPEINVRPPEESLHGTSDLAQALYAGRYQVAASWLNGYERNTINSNKERGMFDLS